MSAGLFFISLFENLFQVINCKGADLQMNAISVEHMTVGLIQDIGANGSGTEEKEHLNLLAICNIFHLDTRATAPSRLKLN